MVKVRGHEPTPERTQETHLGHHGDVLGVRQVHSGVFDSVDHAPVSSQGTTSKLAEVHGDYDGQACFDRSLDLLPYLLASLALVSRCGPARLQARSLKRFCELARRGAKQSEQMVRAELLTDPVDYLAVYPVVASVLLVPGSELRARQEYPIRNVRMRPRTCSVGYGPRLRTLAPEPPLAPLGVA